MPGRPTLGFGTRHSIIYDGGFLLTEPGGSVWRFSHRNLATLTAWLRSEGARATHLDLLDHDPSPRGRSDRTALPPASARLPTALSPPGCWCSVVACWRRGNLAGARRPKKLEVEKTQHVPGYGANRSRAACHVASRRGHGDVCAHSSGGQALRAARG